MPFVALSKIEYLYILAELAGAGLRGELSVEVLLGHRMLLCCYLVFMWV